MYSLPNSTDISIIKASLRMSCRVHSNVLTFGFVPGIYLPDFEEQPPEEFYEEEYYTDGPVN